MLFWSYRIKPSLTNRFLTNTKEHNFIIITFEMYGGYGYGMGMGPMTPMGMGMGMGMNPMMTPMGGMGTGL